jgi:hypothetical protein
MPDADVLSVASSVEEEEDEWMECYHTCSFSEVSSVNLQQYHNAVYYQCWGGGPEGGFIVQTDANGVYRACRVNRTWGTPWTVEPVEGLVYVKWEVDEFGHGTKYIKVSVNA